MLRLASQPCLRRLSRFTGRQAVRFVTSKVDPDKPFEEERLPHYSKDQFYPVRIGEVLDSRYKVLGKLGYGSYSTVWLCRDTQDSGFVTVKVCTKEGNQSASVHRELKFYEHLISLNTEHVGSAFIRELLGTFEIAGPSGEHLCLVHPPMNMTMREFQYLDSSHRMTEQVLKVVLHSVLQALVFLHEEANVIHTDITQSNIMMTLDDESVLDDFEKAEADDPSPTKVIDSGRTIYGSRRLGLPKPDLLGIPVLCDFGQARIGGPHTDPIQPELYRAPEVMFQTEWDTSVDIWNVGVMIWDMLENRPLFNARDKNSRLCGFHHVAEMVAYLGRPPPEYIQRSDIPKSAFEKEESVGGVAIPKISLEESVSSLDGDAKAELIDFVRTMLRWQPEKRMRASELLKHPWMADAFPPEEP